MNTHAPTSEFKNKDSAKLFSCSVLPILLTFGKESGGRALAKVPLPSPPPACHPEGKDSPQGAPSLRQQYLHPSAGTWPGSKDSVAFSPAGVVRAVPWSPGREMRQALALLCRFLWHLPFFQ